jgi:phosphotransferase system enzyme I (PtsI)
MSKQKILTGQPIAPGIALGPAFPVHRTRPDVPVRPIDPEQVDTELTALDRAISLARRDLRHHRMKATRTLGDIVARIFDAHLLFLDDEPTFDSVRDAIRNEKIEAASALFRTLEGVAKSFDAQREDVFRDRAQDVRDVMNRILSRLLGGDVGVIGQIGTPSVLVVQELHPSDVMQLDMDTVLGVVATAGGATSHTAILTSSLGVPSVIGVKHALDEINAGDSVAVNGNSGKVVIRPTETQQRKYETKQKQYLHFVESLGDIRDSEAVTDDGHSVKLMANIEMPHEADRVLANGGDGVGLYRTEYLVPAAGGLPDEQSQVDEYTRVIERLSGKPLTIRTFDLGGDKAFPGAGIPPQPNPFMGWRAVRVAFERDEMLLPQLRAILRASVAGPVGIMFPMISHIEELFRVKALLEHAASELKMESLDFRDDIPVGIMVEVPGVALLADQFAPHVDFFSIGTNDLTQFTLAVDRSNELVADLHDPFHPAVLKLIEATVQAGKKHGIRVDLCGELAGNPLATLLLVGLGVDELSMTPALIPEIKRLIMSSTLAEAKQLAEKTLVLSSAAAVRKLLLKAMRKRFKDMPIWFGDH